LETKSSPRALTLSVKYLRVVQINKRAFPNTFSPNLKGSDPQEVGDFHEGKAASYFLLSNETNKIYLLAASSYLYVPPISKILHTKSTHLEHQYTLQPKSLRLDNNID
jgi:hypothetical protein